MRYWIVFEILFLVLVFSYGCEENMVIDDFNDDIYAYLPLNIGNYWIYDWTYKLDSTLTKNVYKQEIKNKLIHQDGSLIYRYTVNQVGIIPIPNEPMLGYYCAKDYAIYYYSDAKDTVMPGTSVLCHKIPLIKSPLTIGESWIVSNETFKIVSFPSVKVNGINYKKTVLVLTRRDNFIDSTWFAKDIGIVKISSFGLNSRIEWNEWNLKSYSIK